MNNQRVEVVRFEPVATSPEYNWACVYGADASKPRDEYFIVVVGFVPPGVAGYSPAGNCDGSRRDDTTSATLFMHSRFRYLTITGGTRRSGLHADIGDASIIRQALENAEAQATGVPCSQGPEYRVFLGLDDPGRQGTQKEMCNALVARVRAFPNATSNTIIPGEGPHVILGGATALWNLLTLSVPPDDLASAGNIYAKVTRVHERKLRLKILASPGRLMPADVLQLALEVTGGRYPLAVLATHNLLKNTTVKGRQAIESTLKLGPAAYRGPVRDRYLATLREHNVVVAKLASLRAAPATSADKLGPWYHAFGVLTAAALVDSTTAGYGVMTEHLVKWFKAFRNEGGFNKEKAQIDACFGLATGTSTLEQLSRWDLIRNPFG
jgi:hypothetical protein